MIVVADASPLRYLVLIHEVGILPALYGQVLVPPAVLSELAQPKTPIEVRRWTERPPDWLQVRAPAQSASGLPSMLGEGERAAIALSEELHADILLIDDWAGRQEARRRGLAIQGTLGLLDLAAQRGCTNLAPALGLLTKTNFRISAELVQSLLERDAQRRRR